MLKNLFLSIPLSKTYEELKCPLNFPEDIYGISNWVMKFPLTIYSEDLSEKHVFTEGRVNVSKINQPNLQQRWKYFVITRGDGHRYYCTSHIFYEKHPIHQTSDNKSLFSSLKVIRSTYPQYYLPKCLVILSDKPLFKLETNLIKIYRELKQDNPNITPILNEQMYKTYHQLYLTNRTNQWDNHKVAAKGKYRTFSIQQNFEYYLQLCNHHKIDDKDQIYHNPKNNLQIIHVYSMPDSLFRLSHFFHLPLTGETLQKTLTSIFLQKQIIFTSFNQNLNLMVMQTLRQMIRPLKWDFLYVPNLPAHMLDVIQQSFMPFMVGIHKKYLNKIDISQKIVVQLDQNIIKIPQNTNIIVPTCINYFLQNWQNHPNQKPLKKQSDLRLKSIQIILKMLQRASQLSSHKKTVRYSITSNLMDQQFYEQFIKNTTMYTRYKQSLINSQFQPQISEIVSLLSMPYKSCENYLHGKINKLVIDSQYPITHNNEKQLVRYYYHKFQQQYKRSFPINNNKQKVQYSHKNMYYGYQSATTTINDHQRRLSSSLHSNTNTNININTYNVNNNQKIVRKQRNYLSISTINNVKQQTSQPYINTNIHNNQYHSQNNHKKHQNQTIQMNKIQISLSPRDFTKKHPNSDKKPTHQHPPLKRHINRILTTQFQQTIPHRVNQTKRQNQFCYNRDKIYNSLNHMDTISQNQKLTFHKSKRKIIMKKCGLSFAVSSVKN